LNSLDLKINLETCLVVNPNLVLRIEDDDCALLFDPDRGSVQMLNQTAVAIWQNIDGQRSLRHIISELHDQYEGMDAVADQQIIALANSLLEIGAVVTRGQS